MGDRKYYDYYLLLSHWLEAKIHGHSTAEYFADEGYKTIAIYGMGELANRLYEDLERTDIVVRYGIDRDVAVSVSRIAEVFTLEDDLEQVDAIVVTPFFAFKTIRENLRKKITCPVLSLEEIVWSI